MTTEAKQCWLVSLLTFLLLLAVATVASAQQETGNIYGTVADSAGELLPGVSVSVDGMGAQKLQITDQLGKFHILGLDPGTYKLQASLDGFSTVEYPKIDMRAGRNTTIEVQLTAAIHEVVTVTSESPLLDERKVSQGSIITQIELETIPTARDPWAVLNQAPGVLADRVNVGGNESGNQSVFTAPAARFEDNSYLIDGVEITDMNATGASSTYYDFDQFAQIEFSTGGSEITKLTPGTSLNLVTKRGTNEFRGSARFILTDADGYFGVLEQSDPNIDPGDLAPGQEGDFTGNRTNRIQEFGFEAGGPAWRDRVWLWGAWAQNDINTITAAGQPDATLLENVILKVNAQITGANSFVGSWTNGDKRKVGRGAGPSRSLEASWDQRGPSAITKIEDTHMFGSSLFLSGTWSKLDGGFSLHARGGAGSGAPEPLQDSDGILKRNNSSWNISRPSEIWQLDGSQFFGTGRASHELKFGARFREFESSSAQTYPGRQLQHIAGENWGEEPGPVDFFFAHRGGPVAARQEYTSVWLQDTITLGQWTVNGGLRWDLQEGENLPSYVPANPALPEFLPEINFDGNDAGGFDFNTINPRIGLTYALGEERKTLLRASYARFVEQLDGFQHLWLVNPISDAYGYFIFFDTNDNNTWDGEEVDGEPLFLFPWGFDPSDPGALSNPNANDPNLDPAKTDELILSAEHAFLPEFVVGLNLTYRQVSDITEHRKFVRDAEGAVRLANRDDYLLETTSEGVLPDGNPYAVNFYALQPGLEFTGGGLMTNGDREREYLGATLHFTKRLADGWMARGYFNYGKAEWDIPDSFYFYNDPTDDAGGYWWWAHTTQDNDGDLYFDGGRWYILMQSTWAFNLNGMYQIAPERPWGFNVAGNLYGRQGYPAPYWVTYRSRIDGTRRLADATSRADEFRNDDLYTVDLRLDKEFAATGNMSLIFGIDAFNVLNEGTVLRRNLDLTGAQPDYAHETLSPRIYRLSARLNWR